MTSIDNKHGTAIDQTMRYFAFFRYPLLAREIWQHSNISCTVEDTRLYLKEQELLGRVFSKDNYFTTFPDVPTLLERRLKGNEQAARELKAAMRMARFIYQFPFVSFVGISGSLSKGYADEHSDFDYFIITQRNRLWISRTLLHLFKKLTFIVGQQHKFCMNYFIDESALLLEERNIYTAIELSSLVPACGKGIYRQFMEANSWVANFLPNYRHKKMTDISDRSRLIKPISAMLLSILQASFLNAFLMRLTDKKWRAKWRRKSYPTEDYDLAFKTRINISKNHHLNYQKKILEALKLPKAEV